MLPIVTLPFGPKFTFSANLTSNVSVPDAATPIFPVVNGPVALPTTFKFCPKLRVNVVPLSSV